jgi:DNA-binding YbaB/EbfC family protein
MDFSMIKQAMELKSKMDKAQKELAKMEFGASAGNGKVKVVVTGQQRIKSITISPDFIDESKARELEKYILKAVNDAFQEAQKTADRELKQLTGGLKIPGLT